MNDEKKENYTPPIGASIIHEAGSQARKKGGQGEKENRRTVPEILLDLLRKEEDGEEGKGRCILLVSMNLIDVKRRNEEKRE